MIDIGNFATAKYDLADFGKFEALLVTHQHADHMDEDFCSHITAKGIPIYGNADVVGKFPELGIKEITDEKVFNVAGFKVRPVDVPHCVGVDGRAGPPNTGFVIDDVFFHPGDGIEPRGVSVKNSAVPIAGPSISLKQAIDFIRLVGAQKVIPIHYDNPIFYNDPEVLKERYPQAEVIILKNGQTTEI